ncbi:carbohydrate ABC transporter permease [Paludifilum halophilum]|uniref:ABC transporter permease n=1 Tax=Paludifilum halophilum TaxID=1642702 RepID=A0A235BBC4_9BACL|nr:sugar ABC transporter permease [Paludifilum halophilum]OYD09177.1 ABC transporter permease [Paludifilum halophilum]
MIPGRGKGPSEKRTGYLFILPALILIFVIAMYPVAHSFWLSLYDVRLNDPAKSEAYTHYGVNVQLYAENFPFLLTSLKDEIEGAKGETRERLTKLKDRVERVNAAFREKSAFANRYDEVDERLLEGETVPEEERFIEVDRQQAQAAARELEKVEAELAGLKKSLKDPDRVIGLSKGLQDSLIEPNFVGLKYYKLYLQDGRMWASLENTFVFTVISVALELVLGLWIAVVLNREFIGRGLVRASVLIPWALPTAVAALMWKFLFDGQNGILAFLFEKIGLLPHMGVLLTTKFWSMFAVIFADVWKTTPFMTLLILAGLQTIPKNLYEAAEVDGASRIQQFFKITLPMLRNTLLVALLFRTLDAFRVFDLIYVLTGGGPANATETISVYAYKTMFAQLNFGAGSALAVIVFLFVALISMLFVKMLGKDLISDGGSK